MLSHYMLIFIVFVQFRQYSLIFFFYCKIECIEMCWRHSRCDQSLNFVFFFFAHKFSFVRLLQFERKSSWWFFLLNFQFCESLNIGCMWLRNLRSIKISHSFKASAFSFDDHHLFDQRRHFFLRFFSCFVSRIVTIFFCCSNFLIYRVFCPFCSFLVHILLQIHVTRILNHITQISQ